jgi:hypothetical protein
MRPVPISAILIASMFAAACGSSSMEPDVTHDKVCLPLSLSVGTVSNDMDTTNACVTANLLRVLAGESDSTLAIDYTFPVQASSGFIITMQPLPGSNLTPRLHLVSSDGTLLAASPTGIFGSAVLAFVNTAADTVTVRAAAGDSAVSDTGAYSIRVQTCQVPLAPITDSVMHSDVVQIGDCVLPSAAFAGDSMHVHLYSIHIDSASSRSVSVTSPGALVVAGSGRHDDTFGVLPGNEFLHPAVPPTAPSAYAFTLGGPVGGYFTLVIGTTSANPTSYTLTVGSEQTGP